MLITKDVQLKWNGSNKSYLISKGYIFTKINDIIKINVFDLMENSNVKIEVKCDYCGEVFSRRYYSYVSSHSIINKDACSNCKINKTKESNLILFGTEFASQNDIIKEKTRNTCLERFGVEYATQNTDVKKNIKIKNLKKYGVEHTLQVKEFRDKGKHTILQKYGVENPMKNTEIQEKARRTNIQKYGVSYPIQSPEILEKLKQNNMDKYGVEYNGQRQDVKEKIVATYYKNSSVKTSSQQIEIFNMVKQNGYNLELNYPVSNVSVDIALFIGNIKIDIEYDGYHWHKNTQYRDRKRDEFMKSQGWKILRIKGSRIIPTLEEIEESINKLINSDKTFTQIILDDWKSEEAI